MESRATVALVLGGAGRCRQISVLIVLLPLLRVAQDGIRIANGCWQRMELWGFKREEESWPEFARPECLQRSVHIIQQQFSQIGLLFSSPWAVIHLAPALEVCLEQLLP